MDIIVTLPKSESWNDYQQELDKAAAGEVMNFRVSNFPKETKIGERCYIVHKGLLKGWMEITGFSKSPFTCTTTGFTYEGKFIQRSGKFHPVDNLVQHKGFQGFRYVR